MILPNYWVSFQAQAPWAWSLASSSYNYSWIHWAGSIRHPISLWFRTAHHLFQPAVFCNFLQVCQVLPSSFILRRPHRFGAMIFPSGVFQLPLWDLDLCYWLPSCACWISPADYRSLASNSSWLVSRISTMPRFYQYWPWLHASTTGTQSPSFWFFLLVGPIPSLFLHSTAFLFHLQNFLSHFFLSAPRWVSRLISCTPQPLL